MKNEIKGGKKYNFCILCFNIDRFTFLGHNKERVHTHNGIIFCYRKYGAKYLVECETGSVRSKNLTLPVSWDFPVWGTRKDFYCPNLDFINLNPRDKNFTVQTSAEFWFRQYKSYPRVDHFLSTSHSHYRFYYSTTPDMFIPCFFRERYLELSLTRERQAARDM